MKNDESDRHLQPRPELVREREVIEPDDAAAGRPQVRDRPSAVPSRWRTRRGCADRQLEQVLVLRRDARCRRGRIALVGVAAPSRRWHRRRSSRRASPDTAQAGDHVGPPPGGHRIVDGPPVSAHPASATRTPSVVRREQRDRAEMELVVVERPPGARQEIAAVAAGAGEHPLVELGGRDGSLAARTGVEVGEQRALDPGHDDRACRRTSILVSCVLAEPVDLSVQLDAIRTSRVEPACGRRARRSGRRPAPPSAAASR